MNKVTKAYSLPPERTERAAVFIDGANLYAASRTLGFDVDYKNLLAHFRQRSYLVRAYYYTALLETEEYSSLRPLVDWLGYNGYSVVTKPAKEFTDATGRRRVKGSVDVEMAVDIFDLTPHLDHVVIFSGDGDLRRLVESVQRRGVRVTVISDSTPRQKSTSAVVTRSSLNRFSCRCLIVTLRHVGVEVAGREEAVLRRGALQFIHERVRLNRGHRAGRRQ